MYLSQAVFLPTPLRVKSDLFLCLHLGQEIQLESAVVTCKVLIPTSPAVLVHSRQAHRGGKRPVPSRIARNPSSLIIGVYLEGLNCILGIHAHVYQYMILLTCVFVKVIIVPIALVIQDLSILFWNLFFLRLKLYNFIIRR
jgi:hypothetical protein